LKAKKSFGGNVLGSPLNSPLKKTAPVVGSFMSELIQYCEQGNDRDIAPFQYQMKYLKRTLDIGFFSRNREINKESSFSVIG
jgi:sarcosine oxidase subunit beta